MPNTCPTCGAPAENGCVSDTASRESQWRTVERDGLPACDGERWFIGEYDNGMKSVFQRVATWGWEMIYWQNFRQVSLKLVRWMPLPEE